MRTSASPLLPLFRSETLVRLLAYLLEATEEAPAPLTQLARRLGLSPSTVQREVDELEQAGIVRSERFGRMRLVAIDEESPFVNELRALFEKAFGPREVIAEELADLPGVVEAYVFGSWADRFFGGRGPAPADIDVLVIGHPHPRDVHGAARAASKRLGREVQPTVISEEEWLDGDSGFLRTIRNRPLLALGDGENRRIVPRVSVSPGEVRYVLPHPDRGWVVKKQSARRASAFAPTKREAVSRARQIVEKAGGGEIRISNRKGRITDVDTIRPRKSVRGATDRAPRAG